MTSGATISDQLPHRLVSIDQEMWPAGKVGHGGFIHVDAHVVVKRSKDFLEMHWAFRGFAPETVGCANGLSHPHAATGQQRARNARPMVATAILVDRGRAAKFAPNDH